MPGAVLMMLGKRVIEFAANLTRTSLSGWKSGSGTVITSLSTTCNVRGGEPPYTYLWSRVFGDTSVSPTAASQATTFFSANLTAGMGPATATFKCTVTDALSASVDSDTVEVILEAFHSG